MDRDAEVNHPTRFSEISPKPAAVILASVLGLMIAGILAVAWAKVPAEAGKSNGGGDMLLYSRILQRMRGGEGYYPAAHTELLAGRYGTRSMFNWRPPAYLWMLSWFPSLAWPQRFLAVMALVATGLVYRVMRDTGSPAVAIAVPHYVDFAGDGARASFHRRCC